MQVFEPEASVARAPSAAVGGPATEPEVLAPVVETDEDTPPRRERSHDGFAQRWLVPVATASALAFNFVWYGIFLSFPLLGEDGAANYSSLLESVRKSEWLTATFSIKWLEGLGQPNPFTPVTFDPFSWILLVGFDITDAFRVSYALRASTCWLATFLLVAALFRGARVLALTAATLNLLMNFTLANVAGSNAFAAPDVATQAALFPAVLWLFFRISRNPRIISWWDVAFVATVALLLLSYPIHSSMGLVILGAFAVSLVLTAQAAMRRCAVLATAKFVIVSIGLLFAPGLNMYRTWSGLAADSARFVFTEELTTYGRMYQAPYFWHDDPIVLRVIVILAVGVLVLRRLPRPLWACCLTLALIVVGTQVETVLRAAGILASVLERLPRPFYAEFYLPPFYATAAAYFLSRFPIRLLGKDRGCIEADPGQPAWREIGLRWLAGHQASRALGLLAGALGTSLIFRIIMGDNTDYPVEGNAVAAFVLVIVVWAIIEWALSRLGRTMQMPGVPNVVRSVLGSIRQLGLGWLMRLALFGLLTRVISERWEVVLPVCALCLWLSAFRWASAADYLRTVKRLSRSAIPAVALVGLVGGSWATWVYAPQEIHPIFGVEAACRDRTPWCRDPVGRTVGAAATPLTQFLANELNDGGLFRGRADYFLTPGLALTTFPLDPNTPLSDAEFQQLDEWFSRTAREQRPTQEPVGFTRDQQFELFAALRFQAEARLMSEQTVVEIVDWVYRNYPEQMAAFQIQNWSFNDEVSFVVSERNLNFRATGNGMLLKALPLQGIPVSASYELSLDYLYYLLWTRYLNESAPAHRSINMTHLEEVRSDRLALFGTRRIVARDVPLQPTLDLDRIWSWNGYSIYDVPGANTAGYGVSRIQFAENLTGELQAMRDPNFSPSTMAVAADADRGDVPTAEGALTPLESSTLDIEAETIHFTATSAGQTLVVLPFKYSHCWEPTWSGASGRVVRIDVGLIGLSFERNTDVQLRWTAGYGAGANCLLQDTVLIPQARAAAAALN